MEKLIIFLPLLASIISGFFGKIIGNKASQLITSFFVSVSALLSIYLIEYFVKQFFFYIYIFSMDFWKIPTNFRNIFNYFGDFMRNHDTTFNFIFYGKQRIP